MGDIGIRGRHDSKNNTSEPTQSWNRQQYLKRYALVLAAAWMLLSGTYKTAIGTYTNMVVSSSFASAGADLD